MNNPNQAKHLSQNRINAKDEIKFEIKKKIILKQNSYFMDFNNRHSRMAFLQRISTLIFYLCSKIKSNKIFRVFMFYHHKSKVDVTQTKKTSRRQPFIVTL